MREKMEKKLENLLRQFTIWQIPEGLIKKVKAMSS